MRIFLIGWLWEQAVVQQEQQNILWYLSRLFPASPRRKCKSVHGPACKQGLVIGWVVKMILQALNHGSTQGDSKAWWSLSRALCNVLVWHPRYLLCCITVVVHIFLTNYGALTGQNMAFVYLFKTVYKPQIDTRKFLPVPIKRSNFECHQYSDCWLRSVKRWTVHWYPYLRSLWSGSM